MKAELKLDPVLVRALAVTAELTGTELSEAAARVFAEDLSAHPLRQVLAALTRCRREVKGRLVLAEVLTRLDDGRPGAEEAWALFPKHESDSAVITDEMSKSIGAVKDQFAAGDLIGARMTFKEIYQREVQKARDAGIPVRWWPSMGHDKSGRAAAIVEAQERKRISPKQAEIMMLTHAPEGIDSLPRSALPGPQAMDEIMAGLGLDVLDSKTRSPHETA